MSPIIEIIGNSGAGKTTLADHLAHSFGFIVAKEEHNSRPFQSLMASDHQRYACVNQVDYLLFRAEQELRLRSIDTVGILDGGLEEDFFLFTRLFFQRGYLNDAEFSLCDRLYHQLRSGLPSPDLFIWLDTEVNTCLQRFRIRERKLEIARLEDLDALQANLLDWFDTRNPKPMLRLDGNESMDMLVEDVKKALFIHNLIQ